MWDPYVKAVREHVPGADRKIAFAKFHIAIWVQPWIGCAGRRTKPCAPPEMTD